MKMEIESIMEKMEEFLSESTLEMFLMVEEEEFERAAEIRDRITDKIDQICNVLITKNMTMLDHPTLKEQITKRKDLYFDYWEKTLKSVEGE